LIVPYCSTCHRHASFFRTRALAVAAASTLLGGSAAFALPLLWEWLPYPVLAFASLVLAAIPLVIARFVRQSVHRGHSAAVRAVWWRNRTEIVCTSVSFARELANASGTSSRLASLAEPWFSRWMLVGIAATVVATAMAQHLVFARVRVVNLTDGAVVVLVDMRQVARVEPSSGESPAAGAELSVGAGRRRLTAVNESGQIIEDAVVELRGAARHLYAPSSDGYCFWLETTGYGHSWPNGIIVEPLERGASFWPVPTSVDAWFAANPPPTAEQRSTGGALTAVRQARCERAPSASESGPTRAGEAR
jgi:hypothetical protein